MAAERMSGNQQPDLWSPVTPPPKRKRHRTATTSSDGLDDARQSGRLQRAERIVLDALRGHGRLTRHEVSAATGLPLSSVCGRVASLMKSGDVQEVILNGRKLVVDGRHVVEAVIQNTLQRAG